MMTRSSSAWSSATTLVSKIAQYTDVNPMASNHRKPPASSLDRSTSAAFAFFSRRHSSAYGLRRSVSSVSSRRHSSPINGPNSATSVSDDEAEANAKPRSWRWRLLARKVLRNVEEEGDDGIIESWYCSRYRRTFWLFAAHGNVVKNLCRDSRIESGNSQLCWRNSQNQISTQSSSQVSSKNFQVQTDKFEATMVKFQLKTVEFQVKTPKFQEKTVKRQVEIV